MTRVLAQFSCGVTSLIATALTLAQHRGKREVVIVNAFIVEEDEDNRRFLADCERWLQHPITVLRDQKYGASVHEVWRRKRFMKGQHGAPCSMELKRKLLASFQRPGDEIVIGYDADEQARFEDLVERNPATIFRAPLIERGLTKSDCLAMVQRAGIELPLMYRDGFENANCPGCPKGGEGYWNRIRTVRPLVFQRVLEIQEDIGEGAYFFRNRETGERFGLKDLRPDAGRHNEPAPDCSFFCEIAEADLKAAAT